MLSKIQITDKGMLRLFTLYNKDFITQIKEVTGREWNPDVKAWQIPMYNYMELLHKLGSMLSESDKKTITRTVENHLSYENLDICPPKLNNDYQLRDYQVNSLKFLTMRGGGLLCLDFGLGKTVISLSLIMLTLEYHKSAPKMGGEMDYNIQIFIIAPASLKQQWGDEIQKFFGSRLPYVIVEGNRDQRNKLWNSDVPIFIFSYDVMWRDDVANMRFDNPVEYRVVIADEVTRIKSFKARRTKSLKQIQCNMKIGLTGKPLENNLSELYTINDWLGNNIFGSWRAFEDRHIIKDEYGGILKYINLDEVREKLRFIMIRYLKSEVLRELPPIIRQNYYIELNPHESEEYNHIINILDSRLKGLATVEGETDVLAVLTMARMYLDHPQLVEESDCDTANLIKTNMHITTKYHSKLNDLIALLDELNGHNIVIFTQYAKMADIIVKTIHEALNKKLFLITGEIKTKDTILRNFKEEGGILVATDCLSEGHNIETADYIINYDLPWNPVRLDQRESRLHRIGQKNTVNVINMIIPDFDKIETKIRQILDSKKKLIEAIL